MTEHAPLGQAAATKSRFITGPPNAPAALKEAGGARRSAARAEMRQFDQTLVDSIPRLRSRARKLARDGARADDLVQETLVKALNHRRQFTHGSNQGAWLHTILRNTFLSNLRIAKREVSFDNAPEQVSYAGMPQQEAAVRLAELAVAVAGLPPRQQHALLLVGAEGLNYEEAAAACDCPVGTIKSRVHRARLEIQARLIEKRTLEPSE